MMFPIAVWLAVHSSLVFGLDDAVRPLMLFG